MRIISNYHDYYDAVQSLGQDQSVIYLRKTEEVQYEHLSDYPFPSFGVRYHWSKGHWLYSPDVDQFIVGFCGKIYPVLRFRGTVCFNINEVDQYIESELKPKAIEEYHWKKSKKGRLFRRFNYISPNSRREIFEAFFEACAKQQNNFGHLFLEHKCPIFVATFYRTSGKLTTNAVSINPLTGLKELEFFRLFEPFTAYQELSMFVGNIAQPNRQIPEVSDKDLITAKGFDKWSFRKEPKSE